MALNQALVGKEYPAFSFTVDEGRERSFAAAVGDTGGFVPPTFATVPEIMGMAQVVGDPELGLDFTRVVHGEQEYGWRRPLRVGAALSVVCRIAQIRSNGGHEFLVVETQMRDESGELVLTARNTLISRGTGGT